MTHTVARINILSADDILVVEYPAHFMTMMNGIVEPVGSTEAPDVFQKLNRRCIVRSSVRGSPRRLHQVRIVR